MNKILAILLGATVFVAVGFAVGRMTVERPQLTHTASGPTASVGPGTSPAIAPSTPTASGAPVTHPPVVGRHTPSSTQGPDLTHEHEGEMPAPNPGPVPKGVQGPLRDLVEALHAAVRTGDPDKLNEAQRKLTEWVGDDPKKALEVISSFKLEDDPQSLNILMASVSTNQRIAQDKEVLSAFLEVARGDTSLSRRMEAMQFIGQAALRGPEVVNDILGLAKGDRDVSIRVAAIVALRQQAEMDPDTAARLAPEMLQVASLSTDPQVKGQALQAIKMRNASDDQVQGVAAYLREDQDPMVRITAAEQLGDVRPEARTMALSALQEEFKRDSEEDVRRTCMLSIVKDGRSGGDGIAMLKALEGVDPRLSQDLADYVSILAKGEVDLDRIFEAKAKMEQARMPKNAFPSGEEDR